jgi:hypothetical protein
MRWLTEVPCQSNSSDVPESLWRSATASWEPIIGSELGYVTDGFGIFRSLEADVEFSSTLPDTIWTAELVTRAVPTADLNGDGAIDCADLKIVRTSLGTKKGERGFDPHADVNQDGVVNVKDLAFIAQQLPAGAQCAPGDE